jgi:hypothetical protein
MRRGRQGVWPAAALLAVTAVACAAPAPAAAPAAPQVPAGCERYLTVPEVQDTMGRPVRAVLSDNGEDCEFQLGTPADGAALLIIMDLGSAAADLPGLRAVDLDHLPAHGAEISSYYEAAGGRETLVALSGSAFYELVATSEPTAGGTGLVDVRPRLVGLAKKVAGRL